MRDFIWYNYRSLVRKFWSIREKVLEIPIYTITCYTPGDGVQKFVNHTCSWGFYYDFETAERAIVENWGDMFEVGYYSHAVIHKVYPSALAMGASLQHYQAVYSDTLLNNQPTVVKVEEPEVVSRTYLGPFQ